jgi:poly(U)-specific endoribonuclease
MQYCEKYLAKLGKVHKPFKAQLNTLWFKLYQSRKGGPLDSCGFEHVFVGEEDEKKGEMTGMHNW